MTLLYKKEEEEKTTVKQIKWVMKSFTIPIRKTGKENFKKNETVLVAKENFKQIICFTSERKS